MEIRKNIPLAQYTTLKIGGAAKFFVEAKNEEEILEALKFAKEKHLPVFVLGGGSNILVSDKGFDGLVIKIHNTQHTIHNTSIECGAGCQLSTIVNESVKAELAGLEWAAGIPGTVGGAVRGNAGAFGGEISDCVELIRVIKIPNFSKTRLFPDGSLASVIPQSQVFDTNKGSNFSLPPLARGGIFQGRTLKSQECKFAYRDSIFKQNPNLIILSAVLRLKKGNSKKSQQRVKEILASRKEKQPFDFPSSGSFFKNPLIKSKKLLEEYKSDTGNEAKDDIVPAGYLVERVGLKGKKIGGAMVSQAHGNFLVNAGNAKAEDFIILAAVIKTRVRNKFGVQLKEEVEMVGF